MLERRSMFGALIGLTICISVWRISTIQESQMISSDYPVYMQNAMPSIGSVSASPSLPSNVNDTNGMYLSDNKPKKKRKTSSDSVDFLSIQKSSLSSLVFDELPNTDFSTLIDLYDFEFLMNQEKCKVPINLNENENVRDHHYQHQQPFTLILIHSAPENFNKRNVIRETWGHRDFRSRIIFLLGAVNRTSLQLKLEYENQMHNDMVQGNFMDAYRNMTYKHVMALKWFLYYCPDADYLLKTDDDVFVNSMNFYEYIDRTAKRNNLLFCYLIIDAPIKRSYRSKWRISTKEYSGRYYPPYCPGFSILYSYDIVYLLYKEAQHSHYFWVDDVHITGTIAQKSNITITPLGDLYLKESYVNAIINGYRNASSILFLFTSPNLTENQIRTLWKLSSQSIS